MKTLFILVVTVMLLFAIRESAQSQSKQSKSAKPEITNVQMLEALARQMARDDNAKVKSCQMCGGGGDDDVKWFVKSVTTRSVDLNEDGRPEWIMSLCGNHTCSGWIYRAVAGKYEMLFAGYMGDVSETAPVDTVSNGYRDLRHDGGAYAMILKYDGRRYKLTECLEYKPTYNRQGKMLRRKLVRRGPCPK
ncbi:MAG: hypothetical protein AABO57_25585 [Acidobacteriota bacterium]